MARPFHWLRPEAAGLYCEAGDFFIDPLRPVERAVITHGHADHARAGHVRVLATPETLAIMDVRYGPGHSRETRGLSYGERLRIGEATVRLAPAGHILGSAQLVIEVGGRRAVVSGDFKRRSDPTCRPFEVVEADLFITEASFGLPVFHHPETREEVGKLLRSLALFPDRTHLIGVYALGKCQRLLTELRALGYDEAIFVHGALINLSALYERHGIDLGAIIPVTAASKKDTAGRIVLCPPGALADRWSRGFPERISGMASGWMQIRQRVKQRRVELPLIISDHADWDELTCTIREVKAGRVWVTHGQEDALVHYARGLGLEAAPLSLQGREGEEAA
jgi:putative mRNA 3-end processing factor